MPPEPIPPPPLAFYYAVRHNHQVASGLPPVTVFTPQVPQIYPMHPTYAALPLEQPLPAATPLPLTVPSLEPTHRFSNCPGPITEDISIFTHGNSVDLSKAFRVTPVLDRATESISYSFPAVMDTRSEAPPIKEALEERAVSIITEILKRSLLLVQNDEREDRRRISATNELNLTKAPLSWLYILQVQSLIPKETRTEALEGLELAILSFNGAMDGHSRNRPSSLQQTPLHPFLAVCREFGKDLSSALSHLRRKIEEEEIELEILKSIKTVFELTFSFYYKEKGCAPSARRALQHLHLIRTPPHSLELVEVGSTSAADQVDTPQLNTVIQQRGEPNEQHGRIQNTTAEDGLITVFNSQIVPMTPVVAKKNSLFVCGTNPGDLHIKQAAYSYVAEDGRCVIPCQFCLNATYTPENSNLVHTPPSGHNLQRYLTYVGCRYPDGTMLSYIPINYTRLVYESNLKQRQPIMRTGTVTFAFLHVFLPNAVYQEIKQRAKDVYLLHHPNTQFVDHHETVAADGRMVKIEVLVKSERTVRIQDQNIYFDYPVLQALFKCGHDICGPSLMHMRFTSTKRGSQRLQLRLILFGITVTRTEQNYNDAIFDLLHCSPGPIRTPLPVPNSGLL